MGTVILTNRPPAPANNRGHKLVKITVAPYSAICDRLRALDNADLEKVSTFLDWIAEQNHKA